MFRKENNNNKINGLVLQWTPVEHLGIHVDPLTIKAKFTTNEALEEILKKHYSEDQDQEQEQINELIDEIQKDSFLAEFEGRSQSIDLDELKELSEANPVKKLLNLVTRTI